MFGAIFVLNYSWTYGGMWQIAKRVLPRVAIERILFPSGSEIEQYFDKDALLEGAQTFASRWSNCSQACFTRIWRQDSFPIPSFGQPHPHQVRKTLVVPSPSDNSHTIRIGRAFARTFTATVAGRFHRGPFQRHLLLDPVYSEAWKFAIAEHQARPAWQ